MRSAASSPRYQNRIPRRRDSAGRTGAALLDGEGIVPMDPSKASLGLSLTTRHEQGNPGGRPELSIVLPIFNEEAVVDELSRRLSDLLGALGTTWEVVFVNDGSRDGSFDKLRKVCSTEPRYRLVSLSRNFGHQLAITAGLD